MVECGVYASVRWCMMVHDLCSGVWFCMAVFAGVLLCGGGVWCCAVVYDGACFVLWYLGM